MRTQTYQDLLLWREAHVLPDDKFALFSELRRGVLSLAADIVEECASHHTKIFLNYLSMAQNSLEETNYHLLVTRDLGYLSSDEYQGILSLSEEVGRLLHFS